MFHTRSLTKTHFSFGQSLVHNINLSGFKAFFYCFGLSASRYIEYSAALQFLSGDVNANDVVLEIGCGHSILPTLWARLGLHPIIVDVSRDALIWQKEKAEEMMIGKSICVVLADVRSLPFREGAIPFLSCISTIEHVSADGDVQAAQEIGRILKQGGVFVASFPMSTSSRSYSKSDWTAEIPPMMKRLFNPFLAKILRRLKVDRTLGYFERFYSLEDAKKRLVEPSNCIREDCVTLRSRPFVRFLYERLFPTGVLTPLEFVTAHFFFTNGWAGNMEAMILKMRRVRQKRDG